MLFKIVVAAFALPEVALPASECLDTSALPVSEVEFKAFVRPVELEVRPEVGVVVLGADEPGWDWEVLEEADGSTTVTGAAGVVGAIGFGAIIG